MTTIKIKIYTAEEVINAGGLKPVDCLLSDGKREDEQIGIKGTGLNIAILVTLLSSVPFILAIFTIS